MELVSVDLNAQFRDAPQAVEMRCWGVSKYDREWLQRHRDDVEVCAAYLHEHSIECALARPVGPALTARQRRRLAELFPGHRPRQQLFLCSVTST